MFKKNLLKLSVFCILFATAVSALYAEPVRDVNVKNFTVILGQRITAPIDTNLMNASIAKAATNLGWTVEKSIPNEVTLKLQQNNSWWIIIKVCYTQNEYWYEYIDSKNLGANPAKNKIHRNYKSRWIPNLEKHIYAFYTNPDAKPRYTVISATQIADDFTNVKGKSVPAPIDTDKFKKAATKAASDLGWLVIDNKNGELRIKYTGNNWWVITKIVYSKDGYNYIYEDSYNLKANVEKKVIHKNYLGRWIPNLESFIVTNYF